MGREIIIIIIIMAGILIIIRRGILYKEMNNNKENHLQGTIIIMTETLDNKLSIKRKCSRLEKAPKNHTVDH